MTNPFPRPGIRQIPDPQAEMERLAEARKHPVPQPPYRGRLAWLNDLTWSEQAAEPRVCVTHGPSGLDAEGPDQQSALREIAERLASHGEIAINDARAAFGLKPFTGIFASSQTREQIWKDAPGG